MTLVCRGDDPRAGGKARALAELQRLPGVVVPPWFVVLPPDGPPGAIAWREHLDRFRWPERDRADVDQAVRTVAPDGLLAVRSSAEDEDGTRHSHAGLFHSVLDVPAEAVPDQIVSVWRSAFTPTVAEYRRARRLPPVDRPPAVIVQRMVRAERAGVAFVGTAPMGDTVFIGAACGLGSGVVDGTAPTTFYEVSARGAVSVRPPVGDSPHPLTEEHARAVAAHARRAAAHFGAPQDVEWALAGGVVHLLQSRPVTATGPVSPPGRYDLWVNSNTGATYPGVVSPLSFSLARHAQREILRQSCAALWFPGQPLGAVDALLGSMLGRTRGRVYFNRLNWFRLQAALGGLNGRRTGLEEHFREEGLPEEEIAALFAAQERARRGRARAVWCRRRMLMHHARTVSGTVRRFALRVERTLAAVTNGLDDCTLPQLRERYGLIDRELLRNWDGVLVNDYLAMLYRDALVAGLGPDGEAQVNDLLSGLGRVASAEGVLAGEQLATQAAGSPELVAALLSEDPAAVQAALDGDPDFAAAWHKYLNQFGDLATEELKLESTAVRDDPLSALKAIGLRARTLSAGRSPTPGGPPLPSRSRPARLWRRPWLVWVLRQARARFRDRENLRSARTRVYAVLRRLFRTLGCRYCERGDLADPTDVYFLELEEALGAGGGDLRATVQARRAEWEQDRAAPDPPPRFLARGSERLDAPPDGVNRAVLGGSWRGMPCSSGLARGPARLPGDRGAGGSQKAILVTAHADPALAALLPGVAGVVSESGNPFCHLAIVARELGVPMVAGVSGASNMTHAGAWLELDGTTGLVRICTSADETENSEL